MDAGRSERNGVSICARWLRMTPDRNGMMPAGSERDGFSPLSPNFWRMSTSVEQSLISGINNYDWFISEEIATVH